MLPTESFAWDLRIIWQIGRAALEALDPWSLKESFYPPATVYFLFTIYALFPLQSAFIVLTMHSVISLVVASGRKALALLLFFPVAANLAQGQIDLLFLPLILLLSRDDWKSILAAALITLKPQIALVVLPWYVVRWLISDRRRFAYFVTGSAILHLSPLLIRSTALADWIGVFDAAGNNKISMAAGIWQLTDAIPLIALALTSVIATGIALLQTDEKTARAIMAVFNPLLSYYDAAILWNCAPISLLIASGIVALGLAHLLNSFLPLTLVAWTVLFYRLIKNRLTMPSLVNWRLRYET